MRLKVLKKNFNFCLLLFLLCLCGDVLPKNPYKSGEVRADPKGCVYLRCKRGDQCVNRKFWCRDPPCPNMLYCTKSRKESLKGPSSCESVRCSKGFVCLVRVRHCRWGETCQQRIARCVSERDYYDGPASCVDFECPSGLRCILRESLCAKPPCKLVKSCSNIEDVAIWYEGCKSLGCLSEHECFLRRPARNCRIYPCKHTPDCSAKSEEELETNEQCRGWVCPKGEECSALSRGPCKPDSCKISRSCHRPLMIPINVTSAPKHSWRDDMKLSFYSKLEENSSTSGIHHPISDLSTKNQILQGIDTEDEEIETNSAIGKFLEYPIHKAPIYVSPNSRPTSSRTSSASPDIISGRVVQPTVTSLSTWLNHLKLKTGVDAIEAWIKKAERQENYGAFLEWLDSVKDMLGPAAYSLWIEEVRTMTVTRPAFQKWLPPISTSIVPQPSASPDFVESVRNVADEHYQGLGISPKMINFWNDKDISYSHQGIINNGLQNTSAMKNDKYNEESYIFPPKNNTTLMEEPEIITKSVSLSGIPTSPPAVPISELQQFDDRDPRLIERTYPFPDNFGNVLGRNQTWPFQDLDIANPMKFQQTPYINPNLLNSAIWQGDFPPAMNIQRNQDFMGRRFLELSEIPNQQIQTNWSFQQPPNADINSLFPNSLSDQFPVPINPQRDQFSMIRRFFAPAGRSEQLFQFGSSFPYRNPDFQHPYTWQSQFDPSFNSQQQQDSLNQKYLEPGEYPVDQLQTKWSFQPTLNVDSNFFRPINWQENLSSPPNSEWPQERDVSRQFNRRNLESVNLPRPIAHQANDDAYESHHNNSMKENTSWMKYFLSQISQKYVTPENIGAFPTNGEKFGYESWPESSYRGRSLVDVPHRRTKHEGPTRDDVQFPYDERHAGRSRETLSELFEVPSSFPKFPWLIDPRFYRYYLHLWDRDNKNLYDKNNREGPSALSIPSRTHRVDADARLPLPNPFSVNSQRHALEWKYHWPNTYLHNQLYSITEPRPLPLPIALKHPTIAIPENDEHPDAFSKLNRPERIGNRKLEFVNRDRELDSPGQPMAVPDLWNSRFRTSLSSVLKKFDNDRWAYVTEKKRPISTTMQPPVASRNVTPQQVIPLTNQYSKDVEVEDYQERIRDIYNYDDAGIYPLLLSLQGYIETSKEDDAKNTTFFSKNSTILPVYKIEDIADEEEDYRNDNDGSLDCITDPPSNSDDQVINLFQNLNYGGIPDFPNNLKNVFDVEAAMVMKNTTGESDVEIKDIKWDYENDVGDTSVEDPSSFFIQSQGAFTSPHGLSNTKDARDWDGSLSGSRNSGDTENDSYDEVVDYEDKTIPEDRSNYDFQPVNTGDSLNHEEILEDLIDSFYDDADHKRFKKNRP